MFKQIIKCSVLSCMLGFISFDVDGMSKSWNTWNNTPLEQSKAFQRMEQNPTRSESVENLRNFVVEYPGSDLAVVTFLEENTAEDGSPLNGKRFADFQEYWENLRSNVLEYEDRIDSLQQEVEKIMGDKTPLYVLTQSEINSIVEITIIRALKAVENLESDNEPSLVSRIRNSQSQAVMKALGGLVNEVEGPKKEKESYWVSRIRGQFDKVALDTSRQAAGKLEKLTGEVDAVRKELKSKLSLVDERIIELSSNMSNVHTKLLNGDLDNN